MYTLLKYIYQEKTVVKTSLVYKLYYNLPCLMSTN